MVHRAALLARDLLKRIGSGLPATSTSRFACWYVRPTGQTCVESPDRPLLILVQQQGAAVQVSARSRGKPTTPARPFRPAWQDAPRARRTAHPPLITGGAWRSNRTPLQANHGPAVLKRSTGTHPRGRPRRVSCSSGGYCGAVTTQVIVLNGGSSSGRSGIAPCLQAVLPDPWPAY
ncbi:MAG TPA: hypothetical protein VN961_02215 [Streptosporangiaceae bacterium]|nr:hypothetical protein [Streptosporangiaceae bacterium]